MLEMDQKKIIAGLLVVILLLLGGVGFYLMKGKGVSAPEPKMVKTPDTAQPPASPSGAQGSAVMENPATPSAKPLTVTVRFMSFT